MLNLLTLSSIQRQTYSLDVHVRCTTFETFYSGKISVAWATQLLGQLIVRIAVHAPPCFRAKLPYHTVFNTAVVFSSKSWSGYMLI